LDEFPIPASLMKVTQQEPMEVLMDLPDGLYWSVGAVVAKFSYLEWILNRIVYDLKGLKTPDGRQQTYGKKAKDRIEIIFKLMDDQGLMFTVDRDALRRHIGEYDAKRDLLAHAIFVRSSAGKLMVRDAKRGKKWQPPGRKEGVDKSVEPSGEEINAVSVVKLADAIGTINCCLKVLWSEIAPQLKASNFGKI
jgi:hypothetical protein